MARVSIVMDDVETRCCDGGYWCSRVSCWLTGVLDVSWCPGRVVGLWLHRYIHQGTYNAVINGNLFIKFISVWELYTAGSFPVIIMVYSIVFLYKFVYEGIVFQCCLMVLTCSKYELVGRGLCSICSWDSAGYQWRGTVVSDHCIVLLLVIIMWCVMCATWLRSIWYCDGHNLSNEIWYMCWLWKN